MNIKLFLKGLIVSIFLILSPLTVLAGQGSAYDSIVFFGDSLSDNGNLYYSDYGYLPKSPPYFEGRFSNGHVWSEQVVAALNEKKPLKSVNFAIGGEPAIFHNPLNGNLPYSLTASYYSYIGRTILSDRSTTLFVIWIGANDYLPGSTDPEQLSTDVVANIKATIESLIGRGGMNFLVINMPDLSKTPYAFGSDPEVGKNLYDLVQKHNKKLSDAIAEIENSYKEINIHLYDVNKMFDSLLANPSVYNQKYQVNITNTKSSCWTGGYTRKRIAATAQLTESEIEQQLVEHAKKQGKLTARKDVVIEKPLDAKTMAHYIAASPALMEAATVSQKAEEGIEPCENPENYIFWDHIHPTTVVHTILAKDILDFILQNYPLTE